MNNDGSGMRTYYGVQRPERYRRWDDDLGGVLGADNMTSRREAVEMAARLNEQDEAEGRDGGFIPVQRTVVFPAWKPLIRNGEKP